MKKITILMLGIMLLAATFSMATVQPAAAEMLQNDKSDITWTLWVPCANGGAGEMVVLEGVMHTKFSVTNDGNGGFHVRTSSQPQKLQGVGQITGDKYNGNGITQTNDNVRGPFPSTYTYVNNYNFIGQGKGNNFQVHETVHVTINANGEITADTNNYRSTCK